jgi:capsular exopolysaccharide synthesis family protein
MSSSQPALPEPRKPAAQEGQGESLPAPVPAAHRSHVVVPVEMHPDKERDGLPPGLTEPATPMTLFQALRRRWLQAIPLGLVLAVLAGGADWFLRPDKYTAYTVLQISSTEKKVLQDSRQDLPDRNNQYLKTQAALMVSKRVLRSALKQEKVRHLALIREQDDPLDWLERELKAEIIANTELIRLSLASRRHVGDLPAIVNAIQDAYMTEIVQAEQGQQVALLDDMEKIYGNSQDKLRSQRESLRRLADALKTGDSQILSIKQKNLLDEFASLKKELAGVQGRLRDAQVKMAPLRFKLQNAGQVMAAGGGGPGAPVTSLQAAIERELEADPIILKQREGIRLLEEQIAAIDRFAVNADNAHRVEKQRQLEAAQQVVERLREKRRAEVTARLRQSNEADGQLHVREVEEEMKVLKAQEEKLQGELATVNREVDRMGVNSIELELKRNEIDQAEVVLKALRLEKERLQVELQATAKRRVILQVPADEATVLSKLARIAEVLAVAFGTLFLGLFAVSFREFRARKLYTPDEVSRGLRLRVMGTLPALPNRRKGGALVARTKPAYGHRLLIESVDSVRTMLLQGRPAGGSTILMIASACSGEGKTTLAGHLAASLARAGRRTLLVDCDLRNPSLHHLFEVPKAPGMCELLSGAAAADQVVYATPVDGLYLLPAGQFCPAAGAALAQGVLRQAFDLLRTHFDFVVIDSSPVLAVPDALMIGKAADGVVLSVRPGVSQGPLVYSVYERLRDLGLPFLGTVVNGVSDRSAYSHSYHYLSKAEGE